MLDSTLNTQKSIVLTGLLCHTGIGLAMVCAAKGYGLVCVMSEAFSIERRKLMRFLGAKVVLTNPAHKVSNSRRSSEMGVKKSTCLQVQQTVK